MLDATKQTQLQELLDPAQTVLLLLGEGVSDDKVGAALGLADALKSAGKSVTLVAGAPPRRGAPFIGLEQFATELGNQNLSISFAYSDTAVDKVSYHISEDNSRFFLLVKPKKGSPPLSAESVELSYSGAEADIIFTIGVSRLSDLGKLYIEYQELYQNTPIVAIGELSAEFGSLQLTLTDEPSISQLVAGAIFDVGIRPNGVAATNLLAGIELSTDNLRSKTATAETFEIVARLLRAGAERPQGQKEKQAEATDRSAQNQSSSRQKSTTEPKASHVQNTIQIDRRTSSK